MTDLWSNAFKRAVETDLEGERDVGEFIVSSKRKQPGSDGHQQTTDGTEPIDSEDENGGYSQPKKLAKFVSVVTAGKSETASGSALVLDQTEETNDVIVTQERNMADVCSKQICRSWLKHKFLKLGSPCPPSCMRKHEITCRPEHLYKDYSFKGLSAKQRKDILFQLKEA